MGCRLIIDADDFGLTRGINRAVAELHRAGVLTSTTLMATGRAFEDALGVAASLPGLGVGCHVVLVDGIPVSPPNEISTLLGTDRGSFRTSLAGFVCDLFLGRIDEAEIAREAEAQIRRLQGSGIRVTHVDTHKHTHLFPAVTRPLLLAARRCGVAAFRYPFEPPWSAALSNASKVRLLQMSVVRRFEPSFRRLASLESGETTTSGTLGIAATGSLDASTLAAMLAAISTDHDDGILYELVCHPGYNDRDLGQINTRLRAHREVELEALLREVPIALALPDAPRLIHYGDL